MRAFFCIAAIFIVACGDGEAPTAFDLSASVDGAAADLATGDLAGCRHETESCTPGAPDSTGFARGDCCPIGDVVCSSAGICEGTLP